MSPSGKGVTTASVSVGGEIWKFQNKPGSKATISPKKLVDDLYSVVCVDLTLQPLRFTSNIGIYPSKNHDAARGSQLWAEPEHDGGLVVTGAK